MCCHAVFLNQNFVNKVWQSDTIHQTFFLYSIDTLYYISLHSCCYIYLVANLMTIIYHVQIILCNNRANYTCKYLIDQPIIITHNTLPY